MPSASPRALETRPARGLLILALLGFAGGNLFALLLLATRWHFFDWVAFTYRFNTLGMPVILGALSLAAALLARRAPPSMRRSLRRTGLFLAAWGAAAFGTYVYATHVEPNRLVLREVRLASSKITRPLRILHISDLQSDAIGAHEARAFAEMVALAPDLIIHTGDLLQPVPPATIASELPKVRALLEGLTPPLGVFHVQGDTDGPIAHLARDGIGPMRFLVNDDVTLELPGGGRLRLLGLDLDPSSYDEHTERIIHRWHRRTFPDELTVVAGHRPDFALVTERYPIDLTLAGHTHGGQIRLPFIGPLTILSRVPRAWGRGFREVGQTRLNVSAGIGAEHVLGIPSIRINCPPEMTLIELVPAS